MCVCVCRGGAGGSVQCGCCPGWVRGGAGGRGEGVGRFSSVMVFRALLLAHRYLSALTTYFLNVGIFYHI